jgi:hypothetical protein
MPNAIRHEEAHRALHAEGAPPGAIARASTRWTMDSQAKRVEHLVERADHVELRVIEVLAGMARVGHVRPFSAAYRRMERTCIGRVA